MRLLISDLLLLLSGGLFSSRGGLGGFSGSFNSLTSIFFTTSVDLLKLVGVKLGGLENLHLADVDVVNGVDTNTALLDLLGNNLRDQLVHQLVKVADRGLTTHDLHHTLADQVHTTALSVDGERVALVTDSVVLLGSEGNAEHTNNIAIKSLHINVSLDEGLPLANKRLETIVGEIHAVEVSQATTTVNFVYAELHLPVGKFLILLKVSKVGFKHTTLERITGNLETDGLVYASLANLTVDKVVRGNNIIPLLTKEGVLCSLAAKLLARLYLLVLTHCHSVATILCV